MTDDEMYRNMHFLRNEDETFGCYIKEHHDMEQFKRVAAEFLKTECGANNYREVRQGYYKVVPRTYGSPILHFSTEKKRGSKPIMEMQCL